MHSTLVRVQNVFGFFTTVAFSTAILTALSVLLTTQEPSAKIELRNVQVVKGRPHYYSPKKEEYAHIKFDLDAGSSTPPQPPRTGQALILHRLHLSLQLEHEATVCLGCCNLPISRRVIFVPGSHLGHHHQLP